MMQPFCLSQYIMSMQSACLKILIVTERLGESVSRSVLTQ